MKILILLLLALGTTISASDKSFEKFFGKYAAMKMFKECFGSNYMAAWTKNFTRALRVCNQEASEVFLKDLPMDEFIPSQQMPYDETSDYGDISEDNLLNYLPPPLNPYVQGSYNPYGGGSFGQAYPTSAGVYDLNTVMKALQGNITSPILLIPLPYHLLQGLAQQGLYRQKRETPTINADIINDVYNKIRNKAGNFTCIMKSLKFFDENFDVDVSYQMTQIADLEIDAELKSDVFESMSDCIRFASCQPLDRRSLMPPAVQRAISYMKCENKLTLASCVKNDLMKNQDEFDTDALEKIPAGSDMDLGDKMLSILWGKFARRQ